MSTGAPSGTYLIPGFGFVPYSGFWGPVGDIYPLTPVWSESHVPQGIGADSSVEADLQQNLFIPYGLDYTFTIDLTDTLGTPDDTTDDLPAGDPGTGFAYSRTISSVKSPFGWSVVKPLDIVPSGGAGAWDGTLIVTIPVALQDFLGFDQACPFRITLVLESIATSVEYRVEVMYGDIVVRA